ncbi:hypothetical protein AAHC03_0338 [Spirometra sp. Aus1]
MQRMRASFGLLRESAGNPFPALIGRVRTSFTEIDRAGGRNRGHKLEEFMRWCQRIKPWKEEVASFKRRLRRHNAGFDPTLHGQTRYIVRFPQLTDSDFKRWEVYTDASFGEGYSRAEFVRSRRPATGPTVADQNLYSGGAAFVDTRSSGDESVAMEPWEKDKHPFSITYSADRPQRLPEPASPSAYIDSTLHSLKPPADHFNAGYGLFRGFISTKVPKRGDLVKAGFAHLRSPEQTHFGFLSAYNFNPYTHLIIRYRGDGRVYRLNIHPKAWWDVFWFDFHQFPLYTRGGPYWTIAKIPFSRFYAANKGHVVDRQHRLPLTNVRMISFTLMDGVPGPFSFEIDYIGLYYDMFHRERFAYEQYDSPAILK